MTVESQIRSVLFILVVVGSALTIGCWGMAYTMPTDAMRPTVTQEDLCVANPLAYMTGDVERFDIVVFEMPESEKRRYNVTGSVRHIKRVVGLPGETFEIRGNQLFVNGARLVEPFEKFNSDSDRKKDFGPITIPEGEYFLLGDNRPESSDSRYFDHPTIKRTEIYSKITEIKKGYYSNH